MCWKLLKYVLWTSKQWLVEPSYSKHSNSPTPEQHDSNKHLMNISQQLSTPRVDALTWVSISIIHNLFQATKSASMSEYLVWPEVVWTVGNKFDACSQTNSSAQHLLFKNDQVYEASWCNGDRQHPNHSFTCFRSILTKYSTWWNSIVQYKHIIPIANPKLTVSATDTCKPESISPKTSWTITNHQKHHHLTLSNTFYKSHQPPFVHDPWGWSWGYRWI